jgi:hypothetical protein
VRQDCKSIVLYGLVLLLGAGLSVFRPSPPNWDALPYMDLVLLAEGKTPANAHAAVYRDIRGTNDADMATANDWMKAMAGSANLFDEQLPFYSIRPGYILAIRLAHQSGLRLFEAARVVSAAAYAGIGIVLFVWMLRYASAPLALCWCAAIMLSGGGLGGGPQSLAQLLTPDALSTLLILGGMYCVLERQALVPGMLLLLGSLYIRTDDILLCPGSSGLAYVYSPSETLPGGGAGPHRLRGGLASAKIFGILRLDCAFQ